MFHRGNHAYRRFYYRGADGEAYFYDEPIAPDGPGNLSPSSLASLPECPEDADDCQGFEDPVTETPSGPSPNVLAEAVQVLNVTSKDCNFDEEGATHTDENFDQKVPYAGLTISVLNSGRTESAFSLAMFGGDTLEARGDFQSGSSDRACWFFNQSYIKSKAAYDQVIRALRVLGARPALPREGYFDITKVR